MHWVHRSVVLLLVTFGVLLLGQLMLNEHGRVGGAQDLITLTATMGLSKAEEEALKAITARA